MEESPIFIKTFDMIVWLMEHTQKFPKNQRFVIAKRMEDNALDFQEALYKATKTSKVKNILAEADFLLFKLKLYNRMCVKLKLLSFNQFEYLAVMLNELGKMLGGWQSKLKES